MQTRALALTRAAITPFSWIRTLLAAGIPCPSETCFALVVSLAWAVLYNLRFWEEVLAAMWHPTMGSTLFIASLFVIVVCVQALLLMMMPTHGSLRGAAGVLFIVAALSSYFSNTYGAVMNADMMRNVLETDPAEVGGLISFDLLGHVVVLAVLPAILVWLVRFPATCLRTRLRQRALFIPAALALCLVALFAFSPNYAVFFREHKPIRYMLSPAAPVSSLLAVLTREARGHDQHRPLMNPAGNAERVAAPGTRPLIIFLVVGETARAANFHLGGYTRQTNPGLESITDLTYFTHVTSCGTSTSISVPCMFSHLDRARFDADEAGRYTNLLDSLADAGLDVEWRDNNAGCKGVCARVSQIDYSSRPDPALCPQSYCYDEVMLTDLEARLHDLRRDTVIVFHQIGSHGPAYAERYPPRFQRFRPACRSNQLHTCTAEEVRNAYDNTIAYTDYVLSRQIALLQAVQDRIDSVLIYASDHGESLGEQGIYLHGMPYTFAPRLQKEVPMLLWTSRGYAQRARLRSGCLRSRADEPLSHDNLYHTVLGAAEVRNEVYEARLDVLASCREHE